MISIVLSVIVINLIHKIWGEQAPTYLGVERPLEVARKTSFWLECWVKVMYPVIYAGDGLAKATLRLFGVTVTRSWTKSNKKAKNKDSETITDSEKQTDSETKTDSKKTIKRGEIRYQMLEALTQLNLPEDRKQEVIKALDIDQLPVKEIMVPREKMVAISTENSLRENLELMADARRLSRFPLLKESNQEFIGIVYIADVFRNLKSLQSGECSLADLASHPLVVPAELPVSELIDRFQDSHQEMALILKNEDVQGLVTVTEAFEAIAGDLKDPFDE